MAPSSESRGYWLFPGTAPTSLVGDLEFGSLVDVSAAAGKFGRQSVALAA
jgi:hypothetical protein